LQIEMVAGVEVDDTTFDTLLELEDGNWLANGRKAQQRAVR